jgi:hypothetical protein
VIPQKECLLEAKLTTRYCDHFPLEARGKSHTFAYSAIDLSFTFLNARRGASHQKALYGCNVTFLRMRQQTEWLMPLSDYDGPPLTPVRSMPSFMDLGALGESTDTSASTDATPSNSTDVTPDGTWQSANLESLTNRLSVASGHPAEQAALKRRRGEKKQSHGGLDELDHPVRRRRRKTPAERMKYDVEGQS